MSITDRGWWLRWRKLAHDVQGYLVGNADFTFVENALNTWHYPLDLEFTLRDPGFYFAPRDAEGLPIRLYRSVGIQYNPTRIAAYALAHYNRYLRTQVEESRAQFLKAAEWFMRSPEGLWWYTYPWQDLQAPWLSAMAQGEGISVLVRAWVLTHEVRYLDQARRALIPFAQSIEAGGVRSTLEDGCPFLEEYPSSSPVHVLNGFLYALIGLADLHRVAPEMTDSIGLDDFLNTLEHHIEAWDAGFWSLYDLSHLYKGRRNFTTVSYHNLHISQLSFLGHLFRRPHLMQVATRWTEYAHHMSNRLRAFWGKVRYRLQEPAQR